MPICGAVGCSNRPSVYKEVHYYKTPKIISNQGDEARRLSEERRRLWKKALNRKDITTETQWDRTLVCSRHFVNGEKAYLHLNTSPSWVPTLNLGYSSTAPSISTLNRSARASNLERKRKEAVAVESLMVLKKRIVSTDNNELSDIPVQDPPLETDTEEVSPLAEDAGEICHSQHSVNSQTDLSMGDIAALEEDNRARLIEASQKSTNRSVYDRQTYVMYPDKVQLYCGLPSLEVMDAVFNIVDEHMSNSTKALSKEQEFLLCLVKLRQNYAFQDIAFQLNVSLSTVHRSFHNTLDVLYRRLGFLVSWPRRENLQTSMPMCFREAFGKKVSVIIDCFELFSETPSGALNKVYTYSNYKKHQTVKYLIGIAPQGVVTFITPGWGGRTSDKHIVEKSGFLDNLLPGDIVMADRGFTIRDDVAFFQAELVIPDFTRQKKQLNAYEVENTRKIASVRNHVERVIGLVARKFRIFDSNIPIEFLKLKKGDSVPTIDKIVKVACCLSNLCVSIVPLE